MDFDDLPDFLPDTGDGDRFRGSPLPLGCIVISIGFVLGAVALAWLTMKG